MLETLQNSLISLIYPQECSVCFGSVDEIRIGNSCSECWRESHVFTGVEMLCDKCGAWLGPTAGASPVKCFKCDDYYFEKAFAIGVYEKALAAAIVQLKTVPHLNYKLRELIRAAIIPLLAGLPIDIIVPVPLSKARKVERGYNQAEVIAAEFARNLRLPVDNNSLIRKLHTPIHRVGMDQKARELTVKNAFEVSRPKLIAGKNILLVDDVFTSGATTSSCAKALKRNGSDRVFVFTLARAILN